MRTPKAYKDKKEVEDLIKANDKVELKKRHAKYKLYFTANQLKLDRDIDVWAKVGEYLLERARTANTAPQTAQQFKHDIETAVGAPVEIPEFVERVEYVQSDPHANPKVWKIALPAQEFAEQADIHTLNLKFLAEPIGGNYTLPPNFDGFNVNLKADEALKCRICDYCINHCA